MYWVRESGQKRRKPSNTEFEVVVAAAAAPDVVELASLAEVSGFLPGVGALEEQQIFWR